MNQELISIIVPVYNAEVFLRRCVDSIIKQTYLNIEVILINDGSTDGSGGICDEYAKADSRVYVIHKDNGGPASARNAGLEIARGDWYGFVDSDDYIDAGMYTVLHGIAQEKNADAAVCKYQSVYDTIPLQPRENADASPVKLKEYTNIEALTEYLEVKHSIISSHLWNKLFRKELFDGVRFPAGRKYAEDAVVFCKLLINAKTVVSTDLCLYYYYKGADSLTRAAYSTENLGALASTKEQAIFFKEQFPKLYEYALVKYYDHLQQHYYKVMELIPDSKSEILELIKEFNEHFRDDLAFGTIINHPSGRGNGKLWFAAFWIHPGLGYFIKRSWTIIKIPLKKARGLISS